MRPLPDTTISLPALRTSAALWVALACTAGCGAGSGTGAGEPIAAPPPPSPPVVFPVQNRPDVRGTHGAVVSDHPLASAAAYDVLRAGGNAMDAAIAAAAVLAVVRPHMNGVGGDAFALYFDAASGRTFGLNGSGRAGALATPAFFQTAGLEAVPQAGAGSVSVPGAVAAWVDALERFGTRPLAELLEPAIGYAREGFPVSTRLAADFADQGGNLAPEARALYLPGGRTPAVGSLLRNPPLAATLEGIARQGKEAFYEGPVARALADFLEARGGYLREPDFAAHTSTWVEPLAGEYLGHTFLVLPPNTQGLTQLQQMGMARSFAFNALDHNSATYLHLLVEIKKRAFADRERWVADPDFGALPVERLLDPAYLAERARGVDPERAAVEVAPGLTEGSSEEGPGGGGIPAEPDDRGDTVYLTVVDAQGNAVSWIQSLFAGFGSGLLEPTTGVMLQNRGALFTLDPAHPNRIAPGKRPFHTLTPMLALREGRLAFTIGTPGGDAQTQSLLQVVHNLLLFGMTPQQAVEAPRFRSYAGTRVAVEDRITPNVREALTALGHRVQVVEGWTATFGGAQMILVDPVSGTIVAAADPRREAYAIAY
jgi:gamma-glutamyltranspeptidase / glutathione hydrolase